MARRLNAYRHAIGEGVGDAPLTSRPCAYLLNDIHSARDLLLAMRSARAATGERPAQAISAHLAPGAKAAGVVGA